MDIGKIDERLSSAYTIRDNVKWYSPLTEPFTVCGVFYDNDLGMYLRVPTKISEKVSPHVYNLSKMTSGGRIRFKTNSSYVSIACHAPEFGAMPHMPISGSHGFSVYRNGKYAGKITPAVKDVTPPKKEGYDFGGTVNFPDENMAEIEIYMPLYGGVCEVNIGLLDSAGVEKARNYKYRSPIVIYGSSIIQGACVSRPGNDFAMRLSRMLDSDVLNLGFSGCGNAEPEMLEYLSTIDASVYVFDYNYYWPNKKKVPPHYDIYHALRSAKPKTPILMIDKPATLYAGNDYKIRLEMMKDTYRKALSNGDTLIDMIDAKVMFGEEEPDACVVDNNHPNDLGFYRMANALYPKLLKFLNAQK